MSFTLKELAWKQTLMNLLAIGLVKSDTVQHCKATWLRCARAIEIKQIWKTASAPPATCLGVNRSGTLSENGTVGTEQKELVANPEILYLCSQLCCSVAPSYRLLCLQGSGGGPTRLFPCCPGPPQASWVNTTWRPCLDSVVFQCG